MIEHIDKLCDAGISSFKIEGRAKSSYYVAVITNAYRHAIDYYLKNKTMPKGNEAWMLDEVYKVSHREYTNGFYFGRPENGQCYQSGGYVRNFDIAGIINNCNDGRVYFTSKNGVKEGQSVEILAPDRKPFAVKVESLCDADGNACDNANHPMSDYSFKLDVTVPGGSIIRFEK